MSSLSEIAQAYAIDRHRAVNHQYGEHPYEFHLQMVASAAQAFIQELTPDIQQLILAACWCHDLIEDARETYNDVKKVVGEETAEVAYALTNEKGRSRAERANEAYYAGIRATPYATLVKVCDRIANVQHSKAKGSRMFQLYKREYPNFKRHLYQAGEWEDAWQALSHLLEVEE